MDLLRPRVGFTIKKKNNTSVTNLKDLFDPIPETTSFAEKSRVLEDARVAAFFDIDVVAACLNDRVVKDWEKFSAVLENRIALVNWATAQSKKLDTVSTIGAFITAVDVICFTATNQRTAPLFLLKALYRREFSKFFRPEDTIISAVGKNENLVVMKTMQHRRNLPSMTQTSKDIQCLNKPPIG